VTRNSHSAGSGVSDAGRLSKWVASESSRYLYKGFA